MAGIDERREGGVCRVIELAGGSLAAGVLGNGNDLDVAVSQLLVECLPAWQVEPASSPRRPGEQQHFLAAEIGQADGVAVAIR